MNFQPRSALFLAAVCALPPSANALDVPASLARIDASLAQTAAVFKAAFGDKAKPQTAPGAASEDYSDFIIAGVPSVFFSIGGSDPARLAELRAAGKPVPANHSPFFAPTPEPSIRTGVRAITLAVLNALQ